MKPFINLIRVFQYLQIFIFFFHFNFTVIHAVENPTPFYFEPLYSLQNIQTNEVRKLYQDRDGYIWIPSYNGLLRYDGYTITTYRPEVNDDKHYINRFINVVVEDYKHNIWIGTHNGCYRLNKITNEINKISNPELEISNIEAIVPANNGDILIGGSKGLFLYVADTGKVIFYQKQTIAGGKGILDIKSMIKDAAGYIWIGTWQDGLLYVW